MLPEQRKRTDGALLPVPAGELVADLRDADGAHLRANQTPLPITLNSHVPAA